MKKLFLCILCLLMCSVCAAAPAKKVVLWYQVPEVVLEAQNLENDVEKGKTKLKPSSWQITASVSLYR